MSGKSSNLILRSAALLAVGTTISAVIDSGVASADIIPQNSTLQGRFIRVSNNGPATRTLHIGELEAFAPGVTPAAGLDNANDLALVSAGASFESELGVPGHGQTSAVFNGAIESGGDTYSRDNAGYFILDLGQSRTLGKIRVWQRGDACCDSRLSNFSVDVLADNGAGNPGAVVKSSSYAGQAPTQSYASFDFSGRLIRPGGAGGIGAEVVTGSTLASVRIRKPAADPDGNNLFHVGELQAFESGTNANVALSTTGSVFHTLQGTGGHGLDSAVNNGVVDVGGDTWTRDVDPVEGQLDFDQTRQITTLRLFQRGDGCCGERLRNFQVEGYDQDRNSLGVMTFAGQVVGSTDFTLPDNMLLSSSDTLQIELNATTAQADRLQVGNAGSGLLRLSAGSSLTVQNLAGSPTAGQTFDILDAGSIQGAFSTITLPGGSGNWDVSKLYTTGQITFVPEPTTLSILAIAGTFMIRRRTR